MTDLRHHDLIGDIHGHAATLEALLGVLGYLESGSTWRHPEGRQVIFLGDYVDRGPAIRRVLRIVRGMVEAGDALALMGNHEHNAVLYHTPDGKGGHLRPHNDKNNHQHAATLRQFADHPEEWQDNLAWMAELPIWLDLGRLRAVHATWDGGMMEQHPDWQRPGREWIERYGREQGEEFRVAERLLKGLEVKLPQGHYFTDKDGTRRPTMRVKWWTPAHGRSYRDLCIPWSEALCDDPLPASTEPIFQGYAAEAPPVFFGHYWMPFTGQPTLQAPNAACLDYSVAKRGGALAAYRWDGESALDESKYVVVPVLPAEGE